MSEIKYEQPGQGEQILKGAVAPVLEKLAEVIGGIRRICAGVSDEARGVVRRLEEEDVKGVRKGVGYAKKLGFMDVVDEKNLPSLLDDAEEDKEIKKMIIEHLVSKISIKSTLHIEMKYLSELCFEAGVSPDRLIEFFKNEEILEIIMKSLLYPNSSIQLESLKVDDVLGLIKNKIEKTHSACSKITVRPHIGEQILKYIEGFKERFDPKNYTKSIEKIIKSLQEKFPEYDVISWLELNKDLLIRILKEEDGQSPVNHIRDVVNETYEKQSKESGRQKELIKMQRTKFIQSMDEQDSMRVQFSKINDEPTEGEAVRINIFEIRTFFSKIVPKIKTKKIGTTHIRKMIIETCMGEIEKLKDGEGVSLFIADRLKTELREFETKEELKEAIRDIILENTKALTSTLDITNLLADHEQTPAFILNHHKKLFDENGEIRQKENRKILRSLFKLISGEDELTMEETLNGVNRYLEGIYTKSEMESELNFESVEMAKEYPQLIKIACESGNIKEKIAATRKILLAFLLYICKYDRCFVYANEDAKQIASELESEEDGLKIDRKKPLEKMHFIDYPDGRIQLVEEGTVDNHKVWIVYSPDGKNEVIEEETITKEGATVKSVDLIPATFNGIKCSLLPSSTNGDGDETTAENGDIYNYIGIKSLESMITKLIRKEKNRPSDISDVIRMTMVADSIEEMDEIRKDLEQTTFSFGKVLKIENSYGEAIETQAFDVEANSNKSKDYKSLRYIALIPVLRKSGDEKIMHTAQIEIRILLKEDLAKEMSKNSHASHDRYDKDRAMGCVKKLEPKEISPGIYPEELPDEDDLLAQVA